MAAAVQGLQQPSLEAMVPRLVPPDQLVAAGALLSLRRSIGGVAAPAAAVLLIATAGAPAAYLVGLGTFLLSIALLAHVRPVPSARDAGAPPLREFAGAPGRGTPARPAGHLPGRPRRHRFALPTALFPFPAEELAAPWVLGLRPAIIRVRGRQPGRGRHRRLDRASAPARTACPALRRPGRHCPPPRPPSPPTCGPHCSAWPLRAAATGSATPSAARSGTGPFRTNSAAPPPVWSC
ncbi:hypothetical protein CP971_31365 [Streptomyces viridifaciens]|nr:hypothetical protein CP971_31365 [Streptomyces viridifaciens]